METQPIISDSETSTHTHNFSSTVDTSRPFSSVKEAVAIFGERLIVGEIYSPKPLSDSPAPAVKREASCSWRFTSPISSPNINPKEERETNGNPLFDTLKKLEAELEKTKVELKLLKERGSETEVALATLNAELHKNMSKLAQAEAAAAGKAATKTVRFEIERENDSDVGIIREEENKRDHYMRRRMEDSQTLSQIMSLGENDHLFGGKKGRKSIKQKPIIPLVGDLFFKRKTSSTNHHNPLLYASPF